MKKFINSSPSPGARRLLGAVPFLLLLALYTVASHWRLQENPNDKLLPSLQAIAEAVYRLAFLPDPRSGAYLWWNDTLSSLVRLAMGVGISLVFAVVVGVGSGAFAWLRAGISPLLTAVALVPPMAILPIIFIVCGLDELAKVVLIVLGIAPFLARDVQQRVLAIPAEQFIKAQTLGASSWQLIVRVILPQILPHLINALRLSLGAAWLFLIAAEAIAATEGLGYRIFLVRRYMAMDVILPYVAWITCLAYVLDYLLRNLVQRAFPWFSFDSRAGT
jgi:NitT/TauT family transport system permease protein